MKFVSVYENLCFAYYMLTTANDILFCYCIHKRWAKKLVQYSGILYSYPHSLVAMVCGRINETCRLASHLSIYRISKRFPHKRAGHEPTD